MKILKRVNYLLSNKCNLKCGYCFQGCNNHNNLLEENSNHLIDFTKMVIKKYRIQDRLKIVLIGGEPMLYKDMDTLSKVIDIYLENKINILIDIFTNLDYVNDSFIETLSKYHNKGIEISFLSKYINKDLSLTKNQEHNINMIKKYNMLYEYQTLVLDRSNINYSELYFDKIISDEKLSIDLTINTNKKYKLDKNDLYILTNIFFKLIKKYNKIHLIDKYSKLCGLLYISNIINNYIPKENKRTNCEPFVDEIGITIDGYLVCCSKYLKYRDDNLHMKNKNIESILNKFNHEDYDNYNITNSWLNCDSCLLNNVCCNCKIDYNHIELKDNHYIYPLSKCEYEYELFLGQLKGVKHFNEKKN